MNRRLNQWLSTYYTRARQILHGHARIRFDRAGRRIRLLVVLLMLAGPTMAEGFAGLGAEAEGFAAVTAPARLIFPRDHGIHADFRIEWWYLTANLTAADGTEFGAQWTLFRQALRPGGPEAGWQSPQVWMAHAALTSADAHHVAERFARGGIGQAGVTLTPFRAWIDNWQMVGQATGKGGVGDALGQLSISARGDDFAYVLRARAEQPLVLHGRDGFSVKSDAGQASYYYSQPHYAVSGLVALAGRAIEVRGIAWLDREWSSQPLAPDQAGWDWFALHLDSGEKVMVYRLREDDGGGRCFGTWIARDGKTVPLVNDEVRLTPRAETVIDGRSYPTSWRLDVPSRGLAVDTRPLNAQSLMTTRVSYWEGPIRVEGSHRGRGYQELTGY